MKGFVGLMIVLMLSLPLMAVWIATQQEHRHNEELENYMIRMEQKKAIEKNVQFLFNEAVRRSKNKQELIENLIYAALYLENEYQKENIQINFLAGWKNALKPLDQHILDEIVAYTDYPMIVRNNGAAEGIICAEISVGDIKFTVEWDEGRL